MKGRREWSVSTGKKRMQRDRRGTCRSWRDGVDQIRRRCVVCVRDGGNTENNNGVRLHKYLIWISVGESSTSLPAGRTTWCAFSPQTGVDITERTQKKPGKGVSLIRTPLSLCSPIPFARPHSRSRPPPFLLHIFPTHTSPALTLARGLPCESLA